MAWEERKPKEGETVRISWATWYSKIKRQRTTIGVFLRYGGDRMIIDIGDQQIHLNYDSSLEVLT